MDKRISTPKRVPDRQLAARFGDLSITMLHEAPLSDLWRVSFLANFLIGPIYRMIGELHGLSRPEFVILFTLSQQPGLVARDVCLATGLPKNSISRAVAQLLRRELIERTTDAVDRRAKNLELTATGQNLLNQVIPLFETRQSAMRAILSEAEKSEFDRLLLKLIGAMPNWVDIE
jgi:DNA-binding MarR family transcriptional regulator